MEAFLAGAGYGAGFCLVVAVFISITAIGVLLQEKAAARRQYRVIREAMSDLSEEDIAMLQGDENAGGDS